MFYDAGELQDLLEQRLGVRPSTWALTHAQSEDERTVSKRRTGRVTEGMPRPVEDPGSPPAPARWRRGEIDEWIEKHPILQRRALVARVEEVAQDEADVRWAAIDACVDAGVPFAQIAAALTAGSGRPVSAEVLRRAQRRRVEQK